MRLTVFTDYRYTRIGGEVWTERAFVLFLNELAEHHELTVVGREGPEDRVSARYRLAPGIDFRGLPYYESLADPVTVLRTVPGAVREFNCATADADLAWILGPNPIALAFVLAARMRALEVALGVRSDLPALVGSRYPGRPAFRAAAGGMEAAWRRLARRLPCVVVGPELAESYRASQRLHELTVSLMRQGDITTGPAAASESGREILSVGRLEAEKDPLMLAEVLAHLRSKGERWTLRVCGEGPQRGALEQRIREYGLGDAVYFEGYVEHGDRLLHHYRHADALVVPSRSEGVPQTIIEALALGLPVVCSDVGGTRATFGESVAVVPPGDAGAIAKCLSRLERDPAARQRMADEGRGIVGRHTMEAEAGRLGEFLRAAAA